MVVFNALGLNILFYSDKMLHEMLDHFANRLFPQRQNACHADYVQQEKTVDNFIKLFLAEFIPLSAYCLKCLLGLSRKWHTLC
jgi:hypothetical protein